jgi:hypothetical protein
LQAGLFLTAEAAECLSLRISDIIEYSPTKDAFIQAIGAHNVATLEEMKSLHLYDFGIFIELMPDEEEEVMLENNIQMALQQKQIEIEDAIDAREVKNLKLANQLLKLRRKKKFEKDRQLQMENIEAQSRSNAQAAQAAAQSEAQKEQVIMQGKAKMSEIEHQFEIQKLEREAEIKKELMFHEFQLNMQLKQAETQVINNKEEYKENRKDNEYKTRPLPSSLPNGELNLIEMKFQNMRSHITRSSQ